MERGRLIERVVIALLVVAVAWQTWAVRRARTNLDRVVARLDTIAERGRVYQETLEKQGLLPQEGQPAPAPKVVQKPVVAPPVQPTPQEQPKARPRPGDNTRVVDPALIAERKPRRRRAPPLPGANVLNRLYDAADDMAVREQWTQQTYDDVVLVFEDTAEEMKLLWQDLKARQINVEQARAEVELLRDDANGRLADVIGDEGLERLKTHILDERQQ